jgi:putative phosphoribosyl transferase
MAKQNRETNGTTVRIKAIKATIEGNLALPKSPIGIVLFAHGSGSSRFSPRNQYVAKWLNHAGIATLLIDLLTKQEEEIDTQTGEFRFNIELLAQRLIEATKWTKAYSPVASLPIGYFGASTGAAAALIGAAELPEDVAVVVSRGGRPDLAMKYLPKVKAPVLLIVGGNDPAVINMNRDAAKLLPPETKLEIIPGASHLFEEPGKLEKVAELASDWLSTHFRKPSSR